MSNIASKKLILSLAILLLAGCGSYNLQEIVSGQSLKEEIAKAQSKDLANTPLRDPRSVVVCRSRQCAPANLSMSREYVYNSLVHLFENNNHQTALICQANSATRTCTENYITMPIKVGITPAHMYIDSVNITDVIIGSKNQQINLVLNYNVTYNGQSPDCTAAKSVSFARNVNHIMIEDIGYKCKMTTVGYSTVKTVIAIDYIDLDFGFIGGYYSIGVSGPAYGGGTGYMIMRLPKYTEKLAPVLTDQRKPQSTQQTIETETAKTSIGKGKSSSQSSEKTGISQNGVQIFPLEAKKAAMPVPVADEQEAEPVQETEKQAESEATSATRPKTPTQIAPTTYSVTSGNKLAEELKKANEAK